jgi:hypothetical protein
MAIFFEQNNSDACCLCGSCDDLTGEHKIKRTAISSEFGQEKMVIGSFGGQASVFRRVQSPKSKALHFHSKICKVCNGDHTQPADLEFDRLHADARLLLDRGEDPVIAMDGERYAIGSTPYLNVFRYFAKLLCCHMAQIGAPRPIHMSRFATGEIDRNCVWLRIDRDVTYQELQSAGEADLRYAAHGGLVVCGDKKSFTANGFHSTLTVGPIRYTFWNRLTWPERFALQWGHPEFNSWCKSQVMAAASNPMSARDKDRLGL